MLAIVIPYFKLKFFEQTLQSLANQTNQIFKVYIGDDASAENPEILLEKFKGQFDFVYHRFENNLGGISLTQQWERCIALSEEEEWIMVLGDDDILDKNVVHAFYENLEEIKSVSNVVRFASCKIDELGKETSSIYYNPNIGSSTDILFKGVRSSLSEYIFRKKQIKNIGFKEFPLAWFSDVLAVLEFSNFENVYSINTAMVLIRLSPLSISGKLDNRKLKRKATFDFYFYLLLNKIDHFNSQQRSKLYRQINKSYYNDKKNLLYFLKLTYFYCSRFLFKSYFYFLKSLIKVLIKRKNESRI
jgi:hypothetical protein